MGHITLDSGPIYNINTTNHMESTISIFNDPHKSGEINLPTIQKKTYLISKKFKKKQKINKRVQRMLK